MVYAVAGFGNTEDLGEWVEVRVLAVDDDPDVVVVARLNFELDGCEFLWAADGRTGVELARRASPDVILLDSMIPPDGGLVVLNELRETATAHLPVVMFTAEASRDHLLEGLRAGAVSYVTKPFAPTSLVAKTIEIASMDELGRARIRSDAIAALEGR